MPETHARNPVNDGVGSSTSAIRVNSTEEVVEAIRSARDNRSPLRIVGAGTWLGGGRPVHALTRLELTGLSGITEYVPGDLVLTAAAGTPLAEIDEATSRHGQWLPLDPFGSPRSTLGATLATASVGPMGMWGTLPRDVTVGLSFVSGDGMLVQGGGRVVKNVAGFDLVRMTIGAWGTLGAIVGATVRLRARPAIDQTFVLEAPVDLSPWLDRLRAAPLEPLAMELLNPILAARLSLPAQTCLLVRLAGNPPSVGHQLQALAGLGTPREAATDVWSRLRASDPSDGSILRVSRRPTELARLWSALAAIPGADAHASIARGTVRLRFTSAPPSDCLRDLASDDRCIVEQGPEVSSRRSDGNETIRARLRMAFDPQGVLNPGILGEMP